MVTSSGRRILILKLLSALQGCFTVATECDSAKSLDATCSEAELLSTSLLQLRTSMADGSSIDYGHPSWLSSCTSIYLDLGSNIGVQVRKLFEPKLYPDAPVLALYDEAYGPPQARRAPGNVSGLCALGFEPNPTHHPRLLQIEQAYAEKGWRVHFYHFAVAYEDGSAEFTIDSEALYHDWGAKLALSQQRMSEPMDVTVKTISFGLFLKTLPVSAGTVRLMKMDIEGAEWDAVASMKEYSVMCSDNVNTCLFENHTWGSTAHWNHDQTLDAVQSLSASQSCPNGHINWTMFRDETFNYDQAIPPGLLP